jgi:hypothetical protein
VHYKLRLILFAGAVIDGISDSVGHIRFDKLRGIRHMGE